MGSGHQMLRTAGSSRALPAARYWLEFPDPSELSHMPAHEVGQVFRVDITWLSSHWTCLFSAGTCPGIYAAHPTQGCCTLGAHFSSSTDEQRVAGWVEQLDDATWERRPQHGQTWVDQDADGERKTRADEEGCVFLNSPRFPGGRGCALHNLAMREGIEPLQTKPDVCWQLPLRRTYQNLTRGDGSTYLQVTIGEYDRLGWGAGGLDLDWYCTDAPEAHIGTTRVYQSLEPELRELVGDRAYEVIAAACGDFVEFGRHPAP